MFRIIKYKCEFCVGVVIKNYPARNLQKTALYSTTTKLDELASAYKPNAVEKGRYKKWKNENTLSICNNNNNKVFSMIMPPPNITGTLHLGHALTLSIQDVLMRWHRMRGSTTMYPPGLDHAGIATQVVVEKMLWASRSQTRQQIGREAFLQEAVAWGKRSGGTINQQVRDLGAVPSWSHEYYTIGEMVQEAVVEAFIRLFEADLIYRSDLLVNWSCILRSAISDVEVEHLEVAPRTKVPVPGYDNPIEFGLITQFAYKLQDENSEIIVSTTRPETILGDVAVAVHPSDHRYTHLHGKFVNHPFRNQQIPIIVDEFVDPSFGTGAVKITPAHDPVDWAAGKRHSLPAVQVIDEEGNIVKDFEFQGMKRFLARDRIVQRLAEMGLLRSVEGHSMTLPICSRSKDVVEQLVKPQWFVKCKKMAEEAAEDVRQGRLTIQPQVFEQTWYQWLDNIRDWCISRQLWWGHRIPAYRCSTPAVSSDVWVAAADETSARQKAANKLQVSESEIQVFQDEDVLDTWFSSALLPFAVFGWPKKTEDLSRFYPNSMLETGHDILFFWVARMVMLGKTLTGQLPFQKVLLHGIICDAQGRKMSKSLGNVVAPEQVIKGQTVEELEAVTRSSHKAGILSDQELERALAGQRKMFPQGIPECGADSLRFTLLSHNVQSHFINFDVQECHTNRLFCNKIWQALKYTRLSFDKIVKTSPHLNVNNSSDLGVMDRWILSRLSYMVSSVNSALDKKEFHNATASLKDFLYGEFCDVYVESTKPALKIGSNPQAMSHVQTLINCLEISLRCLAPFMPHLCEELYSHLPKYPGVQIQEDVHSAIYPNNLDFRDENLEEKVQIALDTAAVIRRLKKLANVTSKHQPKAIIISSSPIYTQVLPIIETLSSLSSLAFSSSFDLQNTSTISDTVGSYATVHLVLPKKSKSEDSSERNDDLGHLKKKIEKLMKEVEKMEKMIGEDSYRKNAPKKVQDGHSKKLASLREELGKLQQLQGGESQSAKGL